MSTGTHNIPFSIQKRKSHKIILNQQLCDFFQGTQEQVRKSHGERAIRVWAAEGRLYMPEDSVFNLWFIYPFVTRLYSRLQISLMSSSVLLSSTCSSSGPMAS